MFASSLRLVCEVPFQPAPGPSTLLSAVTPSSEPRGGGGARPRPPVIPQLCFLHSTPFVFLLPGHSVGRDGWWGGPFLSQALSWAPWRDAHGSPLVEGCHTSYCPARGQRPFANSDAQWTRQGSQVGVWRGWPMRTQQGDRGPHPPSTLASG